jgi:hypothetical protein
VLEVAAALGGQLDLVFKDPVFTATDREFLSRYGRVEEVEEEPVEEKDVLDGFVALSLYPTPNKKKKRRRRRRWGEGMEGVAEDIMGPNPLNLSPKDNERNKASISTSNSPDSASADTILLAPHLDFDVLASHLSSHPPPLLLLCNDLAGFLEL